MSKLKIALNKNRTFLLWFSSYILVLLVPVTIYFALYANVNQTAKAEVERANSMMLGQFLEYLDESLNEIEQASWSIYSDAKIQSLMYKTRPLSPASIYKIVEIQKDLRNFRISNSNINNIYVYCRRSDMIVSIDDTIRRTDTNNLYGQLTDMSYMQWLSALENTALPAYHIFKQRYPTSDREFDKLTYSRPFPFVYTENMAGTVIITVDVEQLKQKFFQSSYNARDQYYIVGGNGAVLSLNQNKEFPDDLDFTPLFQSGDGLMEGLIDVPGYTCLSVRSRVSDWTYVRFVDTSEVNRRIGALNIFFIISVSISLIVGTAIAFLLTRHNYNPLLHLKQLLGGCPEGAVVEKESDFQYIIRQVQNLQVEKDSMRKELDTKLGVVRDALLMRIMKGEAWGEELSDACLQQCIPLHGRLAVVLAGFEEAGGENKLTGEQQVILVTNLFSKVFNRAGIQGFVTETDAGVVACMAFAGPNKSEAEALECIKAGIGEASAILHATRPEASVTLAYSTMHTGVRQAHAAYAEAMEALEYSWLTGAHAPLGYGAIRGKPNASGFMQQALQHDHHFINCIRAMDFTGARRSLNDIIDTELTGGSYSVRMGKFRMYGLISMLIGAVGELGNLSGGDLLDRMDFIQRSSQCRTVQELRCLVNETLDTMDRMYTEQNKAKMQSGIKETMEFIERNYMDPNLSVAMVAGAMDLHPSYLTQLFKRETGSNTADFIHQTRLRAAKEYLKQYKIKDVANKVGYYDVRTLIRVFRKYEGITPGKFKEMDEEAAN